MAKAAGEAEPQRSISIVKPPLQPTNQGHCSGYKNNQHNNELGFCVCIQGNTR
jgi:hypothetical protein